MIIGRSKLYQKSRLAEHCFVRIFRRSVLTKPVSNHILDRWEQHVGIFCYTDGKNFSAVSPSVKQAPRNQLNA